MATAVKNTPETTAPSLFDRAAAVSLIGVVYVVGCLGIVFKLLPYLFWHILNLNASSAALSVVVAVLIMVAATGLLVLGVQLLGSRAAHGTRAGIFVGAVGVLIILLLTRWASLWFEHWAYAGMFTPTVGASLTAAVGLGLLLVGGYYFLHPKFEPYLVKIEDQGWFSATSFKSQQGFRVRLGTVIGILLIVGAGLWTLYSHGTLGRLPTNWELNIPFTGKTTIDKDLVLKYAQIADTAADSKTKAPDVDTFLALKLRETFKISSTDSSKTELVVDRYALRDFNNELTKFVKVTSVGESSDLQEFTVVPKSEFDKIAKELHDENRTEPKAEPLPRLSGTESFASIQLLPLVQYTLLFLIAGLSGWMAWRIVNFPAFADFLIATEAELNKVSWTTRKKLVQDTIVVLITVFMMAVYLFAMDQAWFQLLSWGPVHIIQTQQENKDMKSVENKPW